MCINNVTCGGEAVMIVDLHIQFQPAMMRSYLAQATCNNMTVDSSRRGGSGRSPVSGPIYARTSATRDP